MITSNFLNYVELYSFMQHNTAQQVLADQYSTAYLIGYITNQTADSAS